MGRSKYVFTEAETDYITKNYATTCYNEMSRTLQCSHQIIRRRMKHLGLRKVKCKNPVHIDIMEDFFGLGLTMPQISVNRGINYCMVNQIVSHGFKKRLCESTKTITLKSKV